MDGIKMEPRAHKYSIIFDAGKPFEDYADTDAELKAKLKEWFIEYYTKDEPFDVFVFNDQGEDITYEQFVNEIVEEIRNEANP